MPGSKSTFTQYLAHFEHLFRQHHCLLPHIALPFHAYRISYLTMYIIPTLIAFACSVASTSLDFTDGYQVVSLDTDPFQLRLAFHGPEAMMGL